MAAALLPAASTKVGKGRRYPPAAFRMGRTAKSSRTRLKMANQKGTFLSPLVGA